MRREEGGRLRRRVWMFQEKKGGIRIWIDEEGLDR